MTAVLHAPTAVLHSDLPPGSPGWHAVRRSGVAASEIAAVLGLSPWETREALLARKRGAPPAPLPPRNAELAALGLRLEPDVAGVFAARHPEFTVVATGMWQHIRRHWQLASPDRLLLSPARRILALLEIKTDPTGEGWGPHGTDQIPAYCRVQVLWQMDTMSVPLAYVGLRIGDEETCREYREYRIGHVPLEAAAARAEAELFLAEVEASEPEPSRPGA
ncbi:lambda-exonuclease family protein [Streptomyces sp. NPDC000594]|uniref:lambda-exonuclease family protein n=1 Tax=Streptomyces sp. NPDC000594 TaxID=3154261 RepID=UPI0033250552